MERALIKIHYTDGTHKTKFIPSISWYYDQFMIAANKHVLMVERLKIVERDRGKNFEDEFVWDDDEHDYVRRD